MVKETYLVKALLPDYERPDDDDLDAQVNRNEEAVRQAILERVNIKVARLRFDATIASENDNVKEDGLYIGGHDCPDIDPDDAVYLDLYAWADAEPNDYDFLLWRLGSNGDYILSCIEFCPFCGAHLNAAVQNIHRDSEPVSDDEETA